MSKGQIKLLSGVLHLQHSNLVLTKSPAKINRQY